MEVKYNIKFCKLLREHLAKGYSFRAFCGVTGTVRSTLYEWIRVYPSFKKAYDIGKGEALLWHEQLLNAKMSGQDVTGFDRKKSDTTALIFALKTRFHEDYGDKQEIDHISKDGSMSPQSNSLTDDQKFRMAEEYVKSKKVRKGKVSK